MATYKYCCICSLSINLAKIPEEHRSTVYIRKKIYIPDGNWYCESHLIKNSIYEEDLGLLRAHSNTASLTALELSKMMETLSLKRDSSLLDKFGEYIRCTTLLPPFFQKFEALFLKSDYLFMI